MTHSTARDRQHLEKLWCVSSTSHRPNQDGPKRSALPIFYWLKLVSGSLVSFLTGTQQLRIWTKNTRTGLQWFAYDPTTEKTISHTSEEGLRAWLEQRHY